MIKKKEMGMACGTVGDRRAGDRFWWGNLMKNDRLEDPALEGRIILKWIFREWDGGHRLDRSGSG